MILALMLLSQLVQVHRQPPTPPAGFPTVEYRATYTDIKYLNHNPLVNESGESLTPAECMELASNAPPNQILLSAGHCTLIQTWR